MTEDVLEQHDGIIHDHPHPKSEAAETHRVEREVIVVEQGEGGDNGDRNGNGDDQGADDIAQKNEKDQDGQDRAIDRRFAHVGNGALDEPGAVHGRDDTDTGKFPVNAVQLFVDIVGHFHGVGSRLLADRHAYSRPAVDANQAAHFLPGVIHEGDVLHVDWNAVAHGHHHVANLIDVLEFSLSPDQELVSSLIHRADRQIHILGADGADNLSEREIQRPDLFQNEIDVNLALQPAPNIYGRDAGDALDPILNLVFGELPQRPRIHVTGE